MGQSLGREGVSSKGYRSKGHRSVQRCIMQSVSAG